MKLISLNYIHKVSITRRKNNHSLSRARGELVMVFDTSTVNPILPEFFYFLFLGDT